MFTCVITGIICDLAYILVALLIGIPLFGKMQMPLSQFGLMLFDSILVIIVYCSIFNFISMMCSEITISTIVCPILFVVMFVACSYLESIIISQPEYITNTYFENGVEHIISKELNPNYPGKTKVAIAETICNLMPTGQVDGILSMENDKLQKLPFYSILDICIINIIGMYFFRKKELK